MNKKESLETVLDTNVVSIKHQNESKQIVYLDTTKKGMPKLLEWKDEYLINDGILPIGQDIFGNLIKFEFIYVANVLIGGAPGPIFISSQWYCNGFIIIFDSPQYFKSGE